MKLFASDLDGTLLGPGDRVHPRDVEAIQAARAQGVIFTLATGRLTSRTHGVARALGLDAPLVCADGGVLACSLTERILRARYVDRELTASLLELFERSALASFVFTHAEIHSCERGRDHHAFVRGWAHQVTSHRDLRSAALASCDETVMLLGIGGELEVRELTDALLPYQGLVDVFSFELAGRRVVRLLAKGTSKGAALAQLCDELGVAREHTAVAGDWYNDLSMFAFAGRSFAMPASPADVKQRATDILEAEVDGEGAIAIALERWLAGTS